MVEVAQAVRDVIHVTTTADTIVDTTEAATIATMTETTTGLTEGDLRHRTTEELTGLAPDRGLILPVAIELPSPASHSPKHRQEMFLSGMIDFRIDLLS